MTLIGVSMYCNDQHGAFEGCVRSVRFGDVALRLFAIAMDRPPRISFVDFDGLKRLLRISGKVFPIRAYSHCMGALHDDHVLMEAAVAAELLNFLKARGTFTVDEGESSLFETWHAEGVRFSAQGLEAACAA